MDDSKQNIMIAIARLETKVDGINTRLDVANDRMKKGEDRSDKLEEKIDSLELTRAEQKGAWWSATAFGGLISTMGYFILNKLWR